MGNGPATCARPAWGAPGIAPRWTRGAKDAIGTAYSTSSRIWFTLAQGTLTEIYYPTVDRPQIRDLQFVFTDGATFCHLERRDCDSRVTPLDDNCLGFRVVTEDRQGRYRCEKTIITDPHIHCVLVRTKLEAEPEVARGLRLYLLCAPHLEVGGAHNNALVDEGTGRKLLMAYRDSTWMALAATVPFSQASCGYVGVTDGWSDLSNGFHLSNQFDCAADGNVALIGQLDYTRHDEFTVGLSMGRSRQASINGLFQSLATPFPESLHRFQQQWSRIVGRRRPLQKQSHDNGQLYNRSVSLLHAHEDKNYPGALIASLSIPWGEAKGDDDLGGYHLVWTRDMCNSASGLLASGDSATALRALIYLAAAQHPDGGFAQNFWIDGRPYWGGIQLDEVAFPIVLAWRLQQSQNLRDFDPISMVQRAMGFLVRHGPATQQERWEEAGGYSPSTLATNILASVVAGLMARSRGEEEMAAFCLDWADFLESHVERWTVTTMGALVPGISRHYIRINTAPMVGFGSDEDPNGATIHINNRPPGTPDIFPARDIVDAGFLELVRYGIRPPGDALMEDSLRVVDALLKVQTPFGPSWKRYNHDGYGQKADGSAYSGWGQGRPWPLLTGERAHYELAAGHPVDEYIETMERLASAVGLLPEQVWDQPDLPARFLYQGRPTGSAMPLMWAHAEYIKLLRSVDDGQLFDFFPVVAERYLKPRARKPIEIWKLNRRVPRVAPGTRLRIVLDAPFYLHYTLDDWNSVQDTRSSPSGLGVEYVDIQLGRSQNASVKFTIRWVEGERWQGEDFVIAVEAQPNAARSTP